MHRICEDIHEAYLLALEDVWNIPEYKCAPRGLPIREILNYSFTVNNPVSESIVTNDQDRNDVIAAYTKKETELYDSKTNLCADFEEASKYWKKIKNPDGTINSAYGHLIWMYASLGNPTFEDYQSIPAGINRTKYTPWEWAKHSLIKDKDSRQALLRFSLPEHQWFGNKDQVCTIYGIFMIRGNKLHLTVRMRSNDLMLGLVYDLPWFVSLMDKMVDELKPLYSDLKKGTYTHSADSMHIYEKDEVKILKMIGVA